MPRLTRLAEAVPAGAEGLLLLPHLMGERGPEPAPEARGALVGLTLRHGAGHLARAALEGTAFQVRRLLEARARLPRDGGPPAAVACGGRARSALWLQVLAAVTGLTLQVPEVVEAAALGAAILGGAAAGALELRAAQAAMVRMQRAVVPEPGAAAVYEACYARYRALDALLGPWWRQAGEG